MKRLRALILIIIFATLTCSAFPDILPTPTSILPSSTVAAPTALLTEEPSATQAFTDASPTPPPALIPTFAWNEPAVKHHHPGDPITFDQIKMVDLQNGWAISGSEVFFTADGAKTWREATPHEILPSGSKAQAQGTFVDAQHAWIAFSVDNQIPPDAVVWNTVDGGHTWSKGPPLDHQAFGEQVWMEGFALDAAHVWLLVRGVYLGAGTHYVAQLLRSANGGFIWSPLVGNETFDYNYDYTGLVFADVNHGLVTWQTTGAYAPGPPNYALTSDGADRWSVHELPSPVDKPDLFASFDYCEPFQPRMLSSNSIRMLMGCFDAHDPPQVFSSYLYSSEDGGSTWTSIRLPEKVLASQATLFFFDKDNALLLGKDIYRSVDGGQSWKYVKSVTWDGQFAFIDPQTGWAIAHAKDQIALVQTSNGGASWGVIQPVIAP